MEPLVSQAQQDAGSNTGIPLWKSVLSDAVTVARIIVTDPANGVKTARLLLDERRALLTGGIFSLCFGITAAFGIQSALDSLGMFGHMIMAGAGAGHLLRWIFVGTLPAVALTGLNLALLRFTRSEYSFGTAALLAGGAFLPLSAGLLLISLLQMIGVGSMALHGLLLLCGQCLTVILLHGGYLGLVRLKPSIAALTVPLSMAGSLWLAVTVYGLLM